MAFRHGVYVSQVPTALIPSRQISASLPVVFGCAPIHRLSAADQAAVLPGSIVLISDEAEAGQRLGISWQYDDFTKWGLSEFSYSQFALYNVRPVVFANLFDPAKHFKNVTAESVQITAGAGQLANRDILPGTFELAPTGGGLAYVLDKDYSLNHITGEITVLDGSTMQQTATLSAQYKCAAPEMVTAADCIGGYDILTGTNHGLALVDDVFPRFRMVPGVIVAPGFSEDVAVAAVMSAKSANINGSFNAICLVDIPSDGATGVKLYTDVAAYKQKNSLVSPDMYLCWPKVKLGDRIFHLSTMAAGIIAGVDADNDDIPFASPSNKNLQIDAAIVDGQEIWIDKERANNSLNANGIATALNFVGGWKLHGNRTAAFPDNTDPKDSFLTSRRMMAWYGNRLVLTWWQKIDWPMTRRLIETVVNSEQINLNSLTAQQYLNGGRIEFLPEENSTLDLMDGRITFHVFLGLVAPAENINFKLEYDPSYLATLFG